MPDPAPNPIAPRETSPANLHLWQFQWVRDLVIVASIVGVVYLGYQIRLVTVPMLLALALAYLFEPLVRWLRQKNICSRRVAAGGIIVASALLFVVPLTIGGGFALVQGARAGAEIASSVSKVQKSLESPTDDALRAAVPEGAWLRIRDALAARPKAADPAGEVSPAARPAEPMSVRIFDRPEMRELGQRAVAFLGQHAAELSSALGRNVASSGASAARAAFTTATTVGTVVFQGILTAMFFYFMSTGWERVLHFWESFIPQTQRGRAIEILGKMDRAIAGFVRGRVTICLILSVYFTIAYWLAGVPMALLLGPIVGMLCIVPYMQMLGVPVATLLMWLGGVHGPIVAPELCSESGGLWWFLLAPIVIHVVANAMDDYALTPSIQGKHTELALPAIVFASIAGGALAGIYGLLLAIPVAACLRILMKEVFWPRLQAWVRGEAKDVLPIGKE
ncbi:MAG TPA: AI-2E family transporter [Phycisphaerales bacterium]|nr:AI-2E family transporter [Phycisphaerales bacterium]